MNRAIWEWRIRTTIITLCGSLKSQKEMMIVTEKMALKGTIKSNKIQDKDMKNFFISLSFIFLLFYDRIW